MPKLPGKIALVTGARTIVRLVVALIALAPVAAAHALLKAALK